MEIETVTLIMIAMIVPNRQGVYAPVETEQSRAIPYSEFTKTFADHPRSIRVSLEPDGESNPQFVTAYSPGLDRWWIVG